MKLHHLGIACGDTSVTLEKIKKLHDVRSVSELVYDQKQQAHVQLVSLNDGTNLELISGKVVKGLIEKKINLYHVCYEVSDIYFEVNRAKENGAHVISMPKPSALFEGCLVAFLIFPYGLVELLESKTDACYL